MGDDRVHRSIEPALGANLSRAGLARRQVVGGQDKRAPREQVEVKPLHRQPLEVDDVGIAGEPLVAEHVRDVLGQLRCGAQARARQS
jgi:hypothetical protein